MGTTGAALSPASLLASRRSRALRIEACEARTSRGVSVFLDAFEIRESREA